MAKVKLGNVKGSKGDKGDRGSLWRVTDKMTGQSTSDTAFPGAGFEDSAVGDMCLNPITCDIYKCTAGGDAATAKWVWVMNNRGPQGEQGPKGDPTTVDAALSSTSTNPVQNKVVNQKFTDVQDSLNRISIVTNAVAQGSSTIKVRLSPKKNGRFMVLVAGNMNSCIPMLSFVAGTTESGDPEFTNIGSLPAKINGVSISGNMLTVTLSTQNYGCVDVFGIGCSVSAA